MKVYLDTNVLVALVLREPGWVEKERWIAAAGTERILSSFAWGEFVDTVARSVRRREATREGAEALIIRVTRYVDRWNRPDVLGADINHAIALIEDDLSRSLKLADAIHLASARRLAATLVTGDRQFASAAEALGVPHHFFAPLPES